MTTLVSGLPVDSGFLDREALHEFVRAHDEALGATRTSIEHAGRAWWHTEVPRRVAYPILGASAALAVVAGLLLIRLSPAGVSVDAIRAEVLRDPATYLYLGIVVMALFVGLGAALGSQTDRLLTETTIDPLTGLHNRRALRQRIDEELSRSARYGQSLSLLLIDLDNFKQVNDRWGHLAGDALLRGTGRAIARTLRTTDYAVRLGGDEFAIISPNTNGAEAAMLATRVRFAIAHDARRQKYPVTASIGISTYDPRPSRPADVLTMVEAADAALYDAKHARKESVV